MTPAPAEPAPPVDSAHPAAPAAAARPWGYLSALGLPALVVVGHALGGGYSFLAVAALFVLFPLLDGLLGQDRGNVPAAALPRVEEAAVFRGLMYAFAVIDLALFAWAAWAVSRAPLTAVERLGLTLSATATIAVLGIPVAHELFHKTGRGERALGVALLLPLGIMPYYLEHVFSHHAHVATPRDPSSARRGDTVYGFYLRSVLGGTASAWRFERRRLGARGRPWWSPANRMLWYLAAPPALAAALSLLLGGHAVAFFGVQLLVASFFLEATNYIEHYGLAREERPGGRFEPVAARHSWDVGERFSNLFLLRLPRHADHHMHPRRRYQVLQHHDTAPKLPAGYPAMVLLTLVPALWRRVMDPRVSAAHQRARACMVRSPGRRVT